MQINPIYYEYLVFAHLDPARELRGPSFIGFKSGAKLPFANRTFIGEGIALEGFDVIKKYYGDIPFSIWVDKAHTKGAELAERSGMKLRFTFPLMIADILAIAPLKCSNEISVRHVTTQEEILDLWVSLISKANTIVVPEFRKLIAYFLSTPCAHDMKFYIGYYNGIPAAASMTIDHGDAIDLHWVATLPEFRNKGLGFAVSAYPFCQNEKKAGKALLFASVLGKPVYEKIGFRTVGECDVYRFP